MSRYGDGNGAYELTDLPGCTQVGVSHAVFIKSGGRGKGLGSAQHLERLSKARELAYNYLICTVRSTNDKEKHILSKNGWQRLDSFVSDSTGHTVEIWGRAL